MPVENNLKIQVPEKDQQKFPGTAAITVTLAGEYIISRGTLLPI